MTRRFLLAAGLTLLSAPAFAQFNPPNPVTNQATSQRTITPSDTVTILVPKAIVNGGAAACNIAMKLVNDTSAITWTNVQAGQILPVMPILILSTGTTCTPILALY